MAISFQRSIKIQKRFYATQAYDYWVKINKGHACHLCGTPDDLECHHVDKLRLTIVNYMDLCNNDEEATMEELKAIHEKNQCPSITLCDKCHDNKHNRDRLPPTEYTGNVRNELWCVMTQPYNIPLHFSRSSCPKGSLGFIAFQTLFIIGHYILYGKMEFRMITLNHRRVAELMGKKPTSSFANLFDKALTSLKHANVVSGHIRTGSEFEIHINRDYLKKIRDHFWFVPLVDVPSKSMLGLSIKWVLNTQSYATYSVSLEKLCKRIGLSYKNPSMAKKYIKEAVESISWISVEINGNSCKFKRKMFGSTPTHSLRDMLEESLRLEI